MILFTPGPCMTTESVRAAVTKEDLNHREPAYLEMVREVKEKLMGVYPESASGFRPYLIGGSGTASVEAMVTSCVNTGPVLLLDGGYYSHRIAEILAIHKIPHKALAFDWALPIEPEAVEAELKASEYEAVLMTHDETTLGRLNDIDTIGRICHRHNVRLLVDAMSSFAAEHMDFANYDAVAASANKCLHGLPGVGFVLVRTDLADQMRTHPRRTYYLHLPMVEGDIPPITPPVSTLCAFRQALREFPGVEERGGRYARQAAFLRKELRARGLKTAIEDSEASCTMSTFEIPAGWNYDRWFDASYERGFVLYACKGHFREKFFQMSTMGEVKDEYLTAWLAVFDELVGPCSIA
jgi:2-aminoethylphosphonate-pyruvate transaminase